MTPAQAKKERAELHRAIRIEEKRKDRARLLELRGRARTLQRARAAGIAEARKACQARRRAVPTLREAAAMLRAARAEARATCDAGLAKAKKLRSEAARARAERDAEKTHQATMRRLERHAKERASGKVGKGPRLAKARVRQQESDDEVRHNIPPELAFLFERVKRSIKGSPRRTRTEEFLDYAHEHPDEELAALEDKTDALIRELEARERRANPMKKKPKTTKRTASSSTRTEVRSPTSTRTEVRSPTKTSTEAYTRGNFTSTVTGGAGAGATTVHIHANPSDRGRGVRAMRVVCGPAWWKLSAHKRAAVVRKLEASKDPRARGAALALVRAEKKHAGKRGGAGVLRLANPREVVSLVYLEQKPGDPEPFEYEHDFEGDRPALEMRGGKAQLKGGSYRTRDGWLEG